VLLRAPNTVALALVVVAAQQAHAPDRLDQGDFAASTSYKAVPFYQARTLRRRVMRKPLGG
jgi:hypothetical protein